jgi:hypothetical protein
MGKLQGLSQPQGPGGWNPLLTFAISEAPPTPASPSRLVELSTAVVLRVEYG